MEATGKSAQPTSAIINICKVLSPDEAAAILDDFKEGLDKNMEGEKESLSHY